jgi:hypothetical protein
VAVVFLAVAGVVGVLAGVQDAGGLDVLYQAQAGTLADSEAAAWDASFSTTANTQLAVTVLTAVAYLAWLSRTVDNLQALTGRRPIATPRWSIIWWFIPIANLFKPFQIVNDLYRRTLPPGRRGSSIVAAWWVFWVLNSLAIQAGQYVWSSAVYLDTLELSLFLYLVGDVADFLAAVLAIVIVLRIQFWADWRQSRMRPSSDPGLAMASAT